MSSASVAVIVGTANIGATGVKVFLFAIRVNGFLLDFETALIACGASARFALLEADTADVISVAAITKEISTRASGLRRLGRDMERFILFPALLVESCGNERFMALSLLVTARVTEFL